jgi:hypothetical protein
MTDRMDQMLAAIEQQHATIVEQGKQIAQQTEHIGLLAQSVAMLLGEETGAPVSEEEESERVDLDGNPY